MKDEPMPKALTDLLHEYSTFDDHQRHYSNKNQIPQTSFKTFSMKRFLTNFDTTPNVIIYHNNVIIN